MKKNVLAITALAVALASCAGTGQGGAAASAVSGRGGGNDNAQSAARQKVPADSDSGFTDENIGVEMAFVRGGTFTMGCTPEQEPCWDFEKPAHSVTLSDYYIAKHTVTQKLWMNVMGTNPSYFDKGDNLPVHNVTWTEVQEFIAKINAAAGRGYRLPTEAEWEYAARGGAKSAGYKYAGSDNINDVAWYDENNGSQIHAAGLKEPNELGLYDMSGNVGEWVSDWYGYTYDPAPQTDPTGPPSGFLRAARGGFRPDALSNRISARFGFLPGENAGNFLTGFRLALPAGGNRRPPTAGAGPRDGGNQAGAELSTRRGGQNDVGADTPQTRADGKTPAPDSGKASVAVYMAGAERKGVKGAYKILGGELARAIGESDKYSAVNRTDAVLEILGREHVYQRGGAVADGQIRDLGRQFGARYLCIAEISEVKDGAYYIDVRLVDVVTAQTAGSATAGSNLADINEMMRVARVLAGGLLGGGAAGAAGRSRIIPVEADDDAKPAVGRAGADFRDAKTGVEMVFVRGGAFTMGCAKEQDGCWETEKPAHKVALSDYYIGKYPVTQKQWQNVMGANPSLFNRGDSLPVHNVTWAEVQEFVSKINATTGKKYRLPTEAEWEYAARGGAKSAGYKYAGSDNVNDVAWYSGNSGSGVQRVGAKDPNELGLYDMSGNVGEWVGDWFGMYEPRSRTDPTGPRSGSLRVQRGGAFMALPVSARVTFRIGGHPEDEAYAAYTGFRLAMTVE